jgi:hypothetical protein
MALCSHRDTEKGNIQMEGRPKEIDLNNASNFKSQANRDGLRWAMIIDDGIDYI